MLWAAQFSGPRLAGLLWALATWVKWVPAPFIVLLRPRGRAWGLVWLGVAVLLSIATLPLTIVQFQAIFGFGGRPVRLDYLVLLWATIPWLWRHPGPLWWLHPSSWPAVIPGRGPAWNVADAMEGQPGSGGGQCRPGGSPAGPRLPGAPGVGRL